MNSIVKWTVLIAVTAGVLGVASANNHSALKAYVGTWWINYVNITLPKKHMEKGHSFSIKEQHGGVWLYPKGPLKQLWGKKQELTIVDKRGDQIGCLTTIVQPHLKDNSAAKQEHVLRFIVEATQEDPDTGEQVQPIKICMADGNKKAADCKCAKPHGMANYHGGYSHAEN